MKILYNKKVDEIIKKEEFIQKFSILKTQLSKIENTIELLEEKKEKNIDSIIESIVLDFISGKEFNNEIIKKLIKKIEVYENMKISITFNF